MKRRLGLGVLVLVIAGGVSGAYLYSQSGGSAPRFRTSPVTRGDLVASVSATGNLNPVTTVQVGSQVSGQIKELFVDFNSQVKRNQLIARIDPSIFEAKVSQARADVEAAESGVLNQRAQVERARADVDNARAALASARAQTAKAEVTLLDARRDLDRKHDLFKRELIARSELDTAQAVHDAAAAQLESARAQEQALASGIRAAEAQLRVVEAQHKTAEATVRQKRAVLQQSQVDLEYTFIRSPVDGVVVARNVDVGQTVAASLSAPTLFNIAQDLTKMQVDTNVDEADIGRAQVGQQVTFTVDSFPTETFSAQVVQIRKAPRPVANVVTYNVVVAVDNPEQKLLPGMTANVRIVVDSRPNVLKLPNAALRFRPPGEEAPTPPAATPGTPGSAPSPQGGGVPTIEQTRERLVRALKLTAEQQKRLEPILEESYAQFRTLARVPPEQRRPAALRIREESRQKIRALLTLEQQTVYDQLPSGQAARPGSGERAGRVWIVAPDGKPQPVATRLGISDGTATEVLGGDLREGQDVIVGTLSPGAAGSAPRSSPGPASPGTPRTRL